MMVIPGSWSSGMMVLSGGGDLGSILALQYFFSRAPAVAVRIQRVQSRDNCYESQQEDLCVKQYPWKNHTVWKQLRLEKIRSLLPNWDTLEAVKLGENQTSGAKLG